MSDGNATLMAGGLKGVSFPVVGTTATCRITGEPVSRQVTNTKGELQTFPSGDPVMQVVVLCVTDQRDPLTPDDRGERNLYIKNRMIAAVRDAVRRAGASGLQPGGVLVVTFTGEEPPKVRGNDPTKLYAAHYTPPPSAANAALMGGDGNGHAAPPQPTVAPYHPSGHQPQHPVMPSAAHVTGGAPITGGGNPGVTISTGAPSYPVTAGDPSWTPPPSAQHAAVAAAMAAAAAPAVPTDEAPAGVDPAIWARMDGDQRSKVLAALGGLPPF